MKSYLTSLIGQKIIDLHMDDESAGMIFEDKSKLSIFNRHQFSSRDINQLTESKVKSINESAEKINIELHNGILLEIFLDNDSWVGPEAVELILPDGQIVVWS
jgi:hypothetical protein